MSRALAFACVLVSACAARPPPPPPPPPPPVRAEAPPPKPPPSFGEWEPTSFGAVMARDDLPDEFDVVFHFHVGKPAEAEYRASGLRAAIITADHGLYAKAYGEAYDDAARFEKELAEATDVLRARFGRPTMHPARIALVAWSAGYGGVRRVLQQRADRVDAVILLDGLHAAYRWNAKGKRVHRPDLEPFLQYAREAAAGERLMVVTHSEIQPPDYASTTETANVLLETIGAERVPADEAAAGLQPTTRADKGDFHLRGFAGDTKEVHVAQLHLIELALREYLAPRWAR